MHQGDRRVAAVRHPQGPSETLGPDQGTGDRAEWFADSRAHEGVAELRATTRGRRPGRSVGCCASVEEPVGRCDRKRPFRRGDDLVEQLFRQQDAGGIAGVCGPPGLDGVGGGSIPVRTGLDLGRPGATAEESRLPTRRTREQHTDDCGVRQRHHVGRFDRSAVRGESGVGFGVVGSGQSSCDGADGTRHPPGDRLRQHRPHTTVDQNDRTPRVQLRGRAHSVQGERANDERECNRHRSQVLDLDDHARVVPGGCAVRRDRGRPDAEHALHDVAAGDTHRSLHDRTIAQIALAHRGVLGRVVPAVLGADPPVETPLLPTELHEPCCVDVRDRTGIDGSERGPRTDRRLAAERAGACERTGFDQDRCIDVHLPTRYEAATSTSKTGPDSGTTSRAPCTVGQ